MRENASSTNVETLNPIPTNHTSLLRVAFQYVSGATLLYHIEIDRNDSDIQVVEKIRKRCFVAISMSPFWRFWPGTKIQVTTAMVQAQQASRDIESQKDGFPVDVTELAVEIPFLTNGLRDPSTIELVQESIRDLIDFAMHFDVSIEDLPVNRVEENSGDTAEDTIDSTTKMTVEISTEWTTQMVSESNTPETADRTRKGTLERVSKDITKESTKDTAKSHAEGTFEEIAGETAGESTEIPPPTAENNTAETADQTSRETAEDSPDRQETTQATAESNTAEIVHWSNKEATRNSIKDSPVNHAERTCASGETAEQTSANNTIERPKVEIPGDRNVLLVRTVWSPKIFLLIVFSSICIGAISGIVTGILTKSLQNGAAVGSIVFGLIPALQSLVMKKKLQKCFQPCDLRCTTH
ncbi:hypothetical protein RUND412_009820 [Rhizina undulata]